MVELVLTDQIKEEDIEFFNLEPRDDYVGIADIKPLQIDGKRENELGLAERSTILTVWKYAMPMIKSWHFMKMLYHRTPLLIRRAS